MDKLKNKVAVITGGSSGIGLASAKIIGAEGAKLVIIGRNAEKLKAASEEIGRNVLTISEDVSSLQGIENVLKKISSVYHHIDILFANAGMSECPSILDTGEHFFDEIINTNVKSVFFLFIKCFPLLTEYASVIFTSSVAQSKARPGDALYSMTKAAVRSLARTLAMDEAVLGKKIRVNAVSPAPYKHP